MRNHSSIASWSAAAKIRTKVIVCIQESENQGGVSLSPVSKPPAPTQRRVWRSWFSLRRKPRRVSQHPVGHLRDRSGIARTLRTCFILRFAFAPRLFRPCRNRVLELITLDYYQDATSACIWDASTAGRCAKNRAQLRRTRGASRAAGSLVFIAWRTAISAVVKQLTCQSTPPCRYENSPAEMKQCVCSAGLRFAPWSLTGAHLP